MLSYRTEIEQKADDLGVDENYRHRYIQRIRVTTVGQDFEERTVQLGAKKIPYEKFPFQRKREFKFVDEYPSVDDFKAAIEHERLILLTRRIAAVIGFASLVSKFAASYIDLPFAEPDFVLIGGAYIYAWGIIKWPFSRLAQPGMSIEVIDSESTAFQRTFPDQKLRNYNPFSAVKRLVRPSV